METNSLIYQTTKVKGGKTYYINIRLNDECKNGHQDFAITGDVYVTGKPKTDKYNLGGGAMGDELAKLFPEFKLFASLHLADYLGNPMYATANGYYHLKNGFNNTPASAITFPAQFCEYYRVPLEYWNELSKAQSEVHYALILDRLGVRELWKSQADEAIKQLEALTGNKFVVDSTKNQFGAFSGERLEEEKKRIDSGYGRQNINS